MKQKRGRTIVKMGVKKSKDEVIIVSIREEDTYTLEVTVGLILLKLNEPSTAVPDGVAPLDLPVLEHEIIDFSAINLGSITALDVKDTYIC